MAARAGRGREVGGDAGETLAACRAGGTAALGFAVRRARVGGGRRAGASEEEGGDGCGEEEEEFGRPGGGWEEIRAWWRRRGSDSDR